VGSPIELAILRKGRAMTVKMVISNSDTANGKDINPYLEGMTLSDADEGVKVTEVNRRSLAWRLGFRPGDLMIGFNRVAVKNLEDFRKLLYRQTPPFLIRIQRDGENLSILLE
jgi:S1-C subfamily serine protease